MFFSIFFVGLLAVAAWCAYMISRADFRRRIIPDVYLWPLMLIGLILVTFFPWVCGVGDAVAGAVFGYALAAIIGYVFAIIGRWRKNTKYDAPIGLGDVKLMAVSGIWLGTLGLAVALVLACASGAIWARLNHQNFIPFGPFMIGGGILTLIGMWFLV